ncbi:DUF6414 family protein [Micromonospora echinaurantiaca]|uniref:DUF6414 family protein n=1 Tax=Micromonospora echinaurantiaca TaxID=47857 RepID=UPI0012FD42F0|nr:hypothetical protein [Micromonospora echinaurantiaca]
MLREFIYVDADKVRSLLAQLDGGVAEELKVTEKDQGNLTGGIRNVASREKVWGTEESTQRSLADAVFPSLEDALTTQGYLEDVSNELRDMDGEDFEEFQERFPPGSFVRVTGPARLFDARYVARAFGGFTTAAAGVLNLQGSGREQRTPGKGKSKQRPKQRAVSAAAQSDELESLIPDYDSSATSFMQGLEADDLRSMVKLARGMFYPGLHLAMSPSEHDDGPTITARLQEGRRFLDSEPDVLFARYGVQEQDWTIVGTIGSYSADPDFDFEVPEMAGDKGIERPKVVAAINDLLMLLGSLGLADHPQHPGFSLVPFGVYRPILPATGNDVATRTDGAVV